MWPYRSKVLTFHFKKPLVQYSRVWLSILKKLPGYTGPKLVVSCELVRTGNISSYSDVAWGEFFVVSEHDLYRIWVRLGQKVSLSFMCLADPVSTLPQLTVYSTYCILCFLSKLYSVKTVQSLTLCYHESLTDVQIRKNASSKERDQNVFKKCKKYEDKIIWNTFLNHINDPCLY